jgi:hypothetical protein
VGLKTPYRIRLGIGEGRWDGGVKAARGGVFKKCVFFLYENLNVTDIVYQNKCYIWNQLSKLHQISIVLE